MALDLGHHLARSLASCKNCKVYFKLWSTFVHLQFTVTAPILYNAFGYGSNLGAAICSDLSGMLWILLFIKESRPKSARPPKDKKRKGLKNALGLLKDSIKTIYRKRENGLRYIIWCIMLVYFLYAVALHTHVVDVQYIRKRFEWEDIEEFNTWYGTVGVYTWDQTGKINFIYSYFVSVPRHYHMGKCCMHIPYPFP